MEDDEEKSSKRIEKLIKTLANLRKLKREGETGE